MELFVQDVERRELDFRLLPIILLLIKTTISFKKCYAVLVI